jgi:2',3'-cyclic-nucleotide 2'-phosphodiesterase (5'-nucleotidase family)
MTLRGRTALLVAALLAAGCTTVTHHPPAAVPLPSPATTTTRPPLAKVVSTPPAPSPAAVPTSLAPSIAPSSPVPAPTASARPHTITLAFAGDVHFEGEDAERLAADPATAMGPIADTLKRADLAMVNLETAITTRGTPAVKAYTFRAPATAFTALRTAGVDIVTMANNHGEDYGPVGLQDTLAAAAAASFPVVGIGQTEDAAFAPYVATIKGQRVAVIGATQVLDAQLMYAWSARGDHPGLASAYNVPRLLQAVQAARASADLVVVYLHWGHELATCPIGPQRDIARQLVAAGADIVVGSHAHVQLGAGRLGSAYVDYGLGNFVFYAHGGGAITRSGVLLLTVSGRTVTGQRWVPAQIEGGIPVPLTGPAATDRIEQWNGLRGCTGLDPVTTPG